MESATLQEVKRITQGWRRAPPVHVIASHKDFPGPADDCTHGMYHRGEVYLLDDAPAETATLLAHEVYAHHGVRELLGPRRWSAFMLAVRAGAVTGDGKLHIIRKRTRAVYGRLRPKLEADEMVARIVEVRTDPRTGRLRIERPLAKRWAALYARLSRDLLHRSVPATMDEVEGVLLEAQGLIQDGRCSTVPPWRWYRPRMTKPMGSSHPPKSVAESEAWIAADKRSEDDARSRVLLIRALPWLTVIALCIIGLLWAVGEVAVGLSRWMNPIVAVVVTVAAFAWWLLRD